MEKINPYFREKLPLVIELLKAYHVKNAYVFGSVLTDKFSQNSDIDMIVRFKPLHKIDYADNYFGLKKSLEEKLHREIDLLEEQALKNPYFLQQVNNSKLKIYG